MVKYTFNVMTQQFCSYIHKGIKICVNKNMDMWCLEKFYLYQHKAKTNKQTKPPNSINTRMNK